MDTVKIASAIQSLKKGKCIVIHDGDEREGESDLICHADFVTPKKIEIMRKDAGGLICLATDKKTADIICLPFFVDLLKNRKFKISKMRCDKTAYGDKPAFSLPINHKDVYTGITDNDRSLTIHKFAKIIANSTSVRKDFLKSFYTPGHVFLLIGRGIKKRRGHTELSLELAKRAMLTPAMVLCEMLGNGNALRKIEAKRYAREHNLVFLEGNDLL